MMVQRLTAALKARVAAYVERDDVSAVRADEALAQAVELWDKAESAPGGMTVDVGAVLAWLYFCRYHCAPGGGGPCGSGRDDLEHAAVLSHALAQRHLDLVPEPLRALAVGQGPAELSYLAMALLRVGRSRADPVLLDQAIPLLRQASEADPDENVRRSLLMMLAEGVDERYDRTGDRADLAEAATAWRAAAHVTPPDDPMRAGVLHGLFYALQRRSAWDVDPAELDEPIAVLREAVALIATDDPDKAALLKNLGVLLADRFNKFGRSADLDESLTALAAAVRAASTDPDRAQYISDLAGAHGERFWRFGNRADLDEAITLGRASVESLPPGDGYLSQAAEQLGSVLYGRFEMTQELADLAEAITHLRIAVAAAEPGHPNLASSLDSLGRALMLRFHEFGEPADLEEAVEVGRRAIAATPADDTDQAGTLANLGTALSVRFEQRGDSADLDESIALLRQAAEHAPPSALTRWGVAGRLSGGLRTRYQSQGDPADLAESIALDRHVVAATDTDDPGRAHALLRLGTGLRIRHDKVTAVADLEEAIGAWREAAMVPTAPLPVTVAAASLWGSGAASLGRWSDALEGYAIAVRRLPLLAWHGTGRASREHQLRSWRGLPNTAIACSVAAGRPGLGVELSEQGRGVLWAQLLDARADLAQLHDVAPDLAARLIAIRTELDRTSPEESAEWGGETA